MSQPKLEPHKDLRPVMSMRAHMQRRKKASESRGASCAAILSPHVELWLCSRLKLCSSSMLSGRVAAVRLIVVALLATTVLPWHELAVTGSAPDVDVEDELEAQGVGLQARMGNTLPMSIELA